MATFSGNDGVVHLGLAGFLVTSAERASDTVIITTSTAHPWSIGNQITVVGIQGLDAGLGDENPNGVFTLTDVPNNTTLEFAQVGTDVGPVSQSTSIAYASAAGRIAEVMSFTVDQGAETIDDTVMGDSWRTHKIGLKNWNGSVECRWDDTDVEQELDIGTQVFCMFIPDNEDGVDNAAIIGVARITGISQTQSFDNTTVNRTITIQGLGPRTLTYA